MEDDMTIVLYVNDAGERRWDGPFTTWLGALERQRTLLESGAHAAANVSVDTNREWVKRHGGTNESPALHETADPVAPRHA